MEVWKRIHNLRGDYSVSDCGGVRNNATGLRLTPIKTGYKKHQQYDTVQLRDAGNRLRNYKVHVLVAEAFIGPRLPGMFVLHNDGITANNLASNLRYGTASNNTQDSRAHNQCKHKISVATAEEIRRRRASGERGRNLATEYGVSEQLICDIHKNRGYAPLGDSK